MYIMTQDSETVFETSFFPYIATNAHGEVSVGNGQVNFLLGTYKNQERAKEVLVEIFAMLESVSKYEMPIV